MLLNKNIHHQTKGNKMNKVILSTIVAILVCSSAIAGETIAPPVLKYQTNVPLPPKRPVELTREKSKGWALPHEVVERILKIR